MEMYVDEEILRKDSIKKKTKSKKKSAMQAIHEWCESKGCKYKDFQILETLGYLKVLKDPYDRYYICVTNISGVNRYLTS